MNNKLKEISFTEFFLASKEKLGNLLIGCEPNKERYFKFDNLYYALLYYPEYEDLHVSMMAGKGSLEAFNTIREMGEELKCLTISWNTSENNIKVNKISEFYDCWKLKEIDNFYPDGSKCIVWVKDLA